VSPPSLETVGYFHGNRMGLFRFMGNCSHNEENEEDEPCHRAEHSCVLWAIEPFKLQHRLYGFVPVETFVATCAEAHHRPIVHHVVFVEKAEWSLERHVLLNRVMVKHARVKHDRLKRVLLKRMFIGHGEIEETLASLFHRHRRSVLPSPRDGVRIFRLP